MKEEYESFIVVCVVFIIFIIMFVAFVYGISAAFNDLMEQPFARITGDSHLRFLNTTVTYTNMTCEVVAWLENGRQIVDCKLEDEVKGK